jgi:hypothetical protein
VFWMLLIRSLLFLLCIVIIFKSDVAISVNRTTACGVWLVQLGRSN